MNIPSMTTVGRNGKPIDPNAAKPFAWSYSRLKNFETCPKRHYMIDISRAVREEESEELKWGNSLHKAAALRLDPNVRKKLPVGMEMLEPWCERLEKTPGKIYTERQLAIASDFGPCEWFAKGERPAWFRSVCDVLKVNGQVAIAIDWKTGKIVEDSVQLALMAACIFAHYPELEKIRTEFIWLKFDASTRADFAREEMPSVWRNLWPRIEALKAAHDNFDYPAKEGGLCKRWCPVTACPHNGRA